MKTFLFLAFSFVITLNSAAADDAPQACQLLTKDMIHSMLGLDVATADNKNSNVGGSTCVYQNKSNPVISITFQITTKNAKMYYQPQMYKMRGSEMIKDAGYEAVYTPPTATNSSSNFIALKGETFTMVTIMSTKKYSPAQFKAFFESIMKKL